MTTGRMAGILWMLMASAFYAAMGAMTKVAVPLEGLVSVVFWRSVIIAAFALWLAHRQTVSLKPKNLPVMLVRSGVGLIAMFCYFWALSQIPLGTAATLLFTSPLFMVVVSGVVLGEPAPKRAAPLTLLAFVGVALIVRPTEMAGNWGELAALTAGVLAAVAYLAVRRLRTTDEPASIVWFFSAFCAVACLPLVIASPLPSSPMGALLMFGVGAMAAGGQICMTWAYRVEKTHVVAPFSYVTVVFAFVLGMIFFDERLGWESALGGALIVVSGAILSGSARAEAPDQAKPEQDGQERG